MAENCGALAKRHLDPSSRLATINMDRRLGGGLCLPPFGEGVAGSPSIQSPWVEAQLRTKWHLGTSRRLATIEMGRNLWRGLRPLLHVGAGSPCNTVAWAEAYFRVNYHLGPSSRLATINMERRLGGSASPPLWGGGLGPHRYKVPGLKPSSVPSGTLVHPDVWPQ